LPSLSIGYDDTASFDSLPLPIPHRPTSHSQLKGADVIVNNRDLMIDALAALWNKKIKGNQRLSGNVYARAVYMRHFNGLKYEEIAKELNISVQSARTYVGKGLQFMRVYIERKYGRNALDA
jgi:hypothetical protein